MAGRTGEEPAQQPSLTALGARKQITMTGLPVLAARPATQLKQKSGALTPSRERSIIPGDSASSSV
jgi:hypothetical protein